MIDLVDFAKREFPEVPEEAEFTSRNLPAPPAELFAESVVIEKGLHTSNSYRVDVVHLIVSKDACFRLALLVLASVLHRKRDDIVVRIRQPGSQVKNVVVEATSGHFTLGLVQEPVSFLYERRSVTKHPWFPRDADFSRWDLPFLAL